MARPTRIPDRGDVPAGLVALRLGMSVADFEACRPELEKRNFPQPDLTTGQWAIEAVDRWRLRRYPTLFPELTTVAGATDAGAVFNERMQRIGG
jgi:hypothetical protein